MTPPAPGPHSPVVSVVLVGSESDLQAVDRAVAAARTVSPPAEVIVVLDADHRASETEAPAGVQLVRLTTPVPFGTAANRGAAAATGRALLFLAPDARAGEGALAPLVDAVVHGDSPCAVPSAETPAGQTLETGQTLGPTSRGWDGAICVRRSAFVRVGGFDAALDSFRAAATELSAALDKIGLETDFEPDAVVAVPAAETAGVASVPPDGRVLVVTSFVPGPATTHARRWVSQVTSDLAAVVGDGGLTVLALDSGGARRNLPTLLRSGVEVVWGPQDWDRWLWDRALAFSHVVLADLAAARRLQGLLEATQPQAHTILALPSLDFRDVKAAGGADAGPDDAPSRRLVVDHVETQVLHLAETAHSAWCASPAERAWYAASVPGRPCTFVPTAAAPSTTVAFAERSGYVVLATPGPDITAGHEDAALVAVREILPALLSRDPNAYLRVVVDDPTPALQLLSGRHVGLVPAGRDPARWLRRSKVCLGWYPRGTGSREAIALAFDARTPFVTSLEALADEGLERLAPLVGASDLAAAALRAEQLHGRQDEWDEVAGELAGLAGGPRSPAAARLQLLRACADAAIAPSSDVVLADPVSPAPEGPPAEPVLRCRNVAVVGSAWKGIAPAEDGPLPEVPAPEKEGDWTAVPVNDQYRRWRARYGPTRVRLDRLARRLRGLVRRPTISVVMPVYNTDPSWLTDAIASVRGQMYEHWELCIADDGSDNPATRQVLEESERADPRIRVLRLPGRTGIAGASNAALAMATGDFVGFLDHDDELKPHALGEVALLVDEQPTVDLIYTDEDKRDPDGELVDPFFKPDWSPDHLMSRNYVCHFLVVRRSLLDKLGGFRLGFDGSQDYDLVLRATELTDRIAHLAEPLYTWRKVEGSTAAVSDAKPWALDAARRALTEAMARRGTPGQVVDGLHPTTYRARYALRGQPKVSILIPTRDKADLLSSSVRSIQERSTYDNYELIVIDNQSSQPDTLAYLAAFPGRVVRYPFRFNYSRMMNLAAREARGDLLLFLNNDTEVLSPEWLEALVEHGQRPEVGIVAPRLRYPTGEPQHEGTVVGYKGGHAGNVDHRGFWGMGDIVRNCSAVTGACLMIRPSVYWQLGGLEERLRIAFNDVDLCLRARQAGYEVVYTPYAELMHVEGGTRGIHAHPDDDDRFEGRWVTHKCLDPYYNPNFERLYPFRIRG